MSNEMTRDVERAGAGAGAAGAGAAGAAGAGATGAATHKDLMPLYYAIVKHFMDGHADSADGVIEALKPLYGDYKLLTRKDVEEALATAKENGLLDEVDYDVDEHGALRVFFQVNDFGRNMINRYIGKYSNPA